MIDKPENPQAFPCSRWTSNNQDVHEGMTMRDYFAAAALTGFTANEQLINIAHKTATELGKDPEEITAIMCYGFADALLKVRKP